MLCVGRSVARDQKYGPSIQTNAMVYVAPPWWYNAYSPQVYAKSEVCTMDVIDGCSAKFPNDSEARGAYREGARDSYLVSNLGRSKAVGSGQMDAYASGFHATSVLCGGLYSGHAPFATTRWW